MKISISIIIVNFNGEKYVKDCIDSVIKSLKVTNLVKTEVVVVENGSIDNSWLLLEKQYKNNSKIKLVKSKENLFFAGGSNLGAREARGEWLVFLNSDTVVSKNWLGELWKVVEEQKDERLMLQPKIKIFKTSKIDCVIGKYVWPGFGKAMGRGRQDNYTGLVWEDYANGTCLMVNKDWFFKLGGFDEILRFFYEDVDLQIRAKKQGGRAVGVMNSVIEHKGSLSFKQNVTLDKAIFYYRRNRLITVLKNFKGFERWVRWGSLVMISLFAKRIKMSIKAMLMSLDWVMGEYYVKQRLQELKQVVKKKRFSLLDLGCGDGKLVEEAQAHEVEAEGIDKKQGVEIEKFKTNQKFDVISMYHVLEHLDEPVEQLKRIKKWLKKDGMLVVEVPLVGNLTEKWLKKDYLAYWDKTHVNFWTKQELLKVTEKAGFKVIKKGVVWHQVFFHVITAKLGRGAGEVLLGGLLWLPFKILSIVGENDEMMRVYCKL